MARVIRYEILPLLLSGDGLYVFGIVGWQEFRGVQSAVKKIELELRSTVSGVVHYCTKICSNVRISIG
jgi:hypothetical protein